jgi:hypothetical protein
MQTESYKDEMPVRMQGSKTLFFYWKITCAIWLAILSVIVTRDWDQWKPDTQFILLALLPPAVLLLVGAICAQIWRNLKKLKSRWWFELRENVRTGLLRLYLVATVPWVAWYGYQIYEFINGHYYWHWHDISHSFWSLLIIPIGSPVSLALLLWVVEGFRKSVASEKLKVSDEKLRLASSPNASGPPDVLAIYEKLDRLMTDEKAQCDGLPEPFRSQVLGGDDCDEIIGAAGEFGRDQRNPIPVNGPLGEIIYLSNNITTDHVSSLRLCWEHRCI